MRQTTELPTKTAELALGLYFGDLVAPDLPQGRLKGKMQRLSDLIMSEFRGMPKLSATAEAEAKKRVQRFVAATSWQGKSISYLTITNLLLCLYEDRPYGQKLIPVLNDIYEYFARVKRAQAACELAAAQAAKKWEEAK